MRVAIFNGIGKPITIEDVAAAPLKPNEVHIAAEELHDVNAHLKVQFMPD